MRPAEPRVARRQAQNPPTVTGAILLSSLVVFLLGARRHTEAFRSIATELAPRASGAAVGCCLMEPAVVGSPPLASCGARLRN